MRFSRSEEDPDRGEPISFIGEAMLHWLQQAHTIRIEGLVTVYRRMQAEGRNART